MISNSDTKISTLENWSGMIGVDYHPFFELEASADAQLSRYIVEHDAFETVWGDYVSVVFAPAGGGKTALRARAVQNCWAGQDTTRPLPVSYQPRLLSSTGDILTFEDHLQAINQTLATSLFFTLAHRPHWFLRLDLADQRQVCRVIAENLPGRLENYIIPCQQEGNLDSLRELIPPAFLPVIIPDEEQQIKFFAALSALIPASPVPGLPEQCWQALTHLVFNILGLPSIYLLLDGLDAILETARDPLLAIQNIKPLLGVSTAWSQQNIYLKYFIPIETQSSFIDYYPDFGNIHKMSICWTPERLLEMVKRRLLVASAGSYVSFDQISSPDISGLDEILINEVKALPREVLVLIQRIIQTHIQNGTDHDPLLQSSDVKAAIAWYHQKI